jgi:hypothetical protein
LGALITHLETMLGRGYTDLELVRAIEDELSGGDFLDAELAAGDVMARARASESALGSGRLGREAMGAAHRGGLFLPSELPVLAASRPADPAWAAREALRFLCFAFMAAELVRRVKKHAMHPDDLESAVLELAARLSRVRIYEGRRLGSLR